MSSVLSNVRRIWRDHIAGPTLRTYEQACEELGGMPWRPATETDRWFIGAQPPRLPSHEKLPTLSVDKLPTLDTGAIDLRRSMSDGTKLVFVGGAAILLFALVAVLLSGGTPANAATSAIAPAAATVAAAQPVPSAPIALPSSPTATAPAVTGSAPSPSVQSLFSTHPRLAAKRHVVLARHRKK